MDSKLKVQSAETLSINDDEIDLFELWNGLVEEKWTIVIVTFSIVLLAGIYAFLAPKTYEVKSSILPPLESSISELIYPGINELSANSIYSRFTEILTSKDTFVKLLENKQINQLITDAQGTDVFSLIEKGISIELPTQSKNPQMVETFSPTNINAQFTDASLSFLAVSELLNTAKNLAKIAIKNDLIIAVESKLDNNQQLFLLENNKINQEIKSKLVQLRDWFKAAEQLGIKTPVSPFDYQKAGIRDTKIDLSSQSPVGYWLGTDVLGVEIQLLESRENNLDYSAKLREILAEKQKLMAALSKLKKAEFDVFRMALTPVHSLKPIKPKKSLIVAVAGVLGLMLGIFIALIRRAVNKRRQEGLPAA